MKIIPMTHICVAAIISILVVVASACSVDSEEPEVVADLSEVELSDVELRPAGDGYEIISEMDQILVTTEDIDLDGAMASETVLVPESSDLDPYNACFRCSFCSCAAGHCVCYGCVPIQCQLQ